MNNFQYRFQARDNRGAVVTNRSFTLQLIVRQGTVAGAAVFTETHNVHTDASGWAEVVIGTGQPVSGAMSAIRCGYFRYYLDLQYGTSATGPFTTFGTIEVPNVFSGAAGVSPPDGGTCNSFIISPQGNIGVGTLTPQRSFEVVGDMAADGQIFIKDAVVKVTDMGSNNLNHSNLFFGWNNGPLTGSVAKYENIVIGKNAGESAENLMQNILIGTNAGRNLDGSSNNNILIGSNAGVSDGGSMTSNNICIGEQAGQEMKGHMESNVFIGEKAGFDAQDCESCIAIGKYAGNNNMANFNIFIGHNAGIHNTTGEANTFVGSMDTGAYNTTGRWNTFLGGSSGEDNVSGSFNTYLGHSSGSGSKGSGNTFVGHEAGIQCRDGNENVFIGHYAGKNENGSHRLYIANTDTGDPLIYGEFDNQKAAVNGDLGIRTKNPQRALHVKDVMRLEPRTSAPLNPAEGDMYMDQSDHKLKVFDGSQWKSCW
ncbi:MAG: hypothetical protein JXA03_11735 [Bacteroidales bacterium]|nr:hypothetical protein [Bacteroidales bacterium]